MDWLSECNVVTADSDGTFNLMPVELPCDGTQALRFPMGNGEYYYLEYRQPLGTFDSKASLSGILVRAANGYNGAPVTKVLDMDLETSGRFMRTGDTLTDYLDRLSFTVLEEHPTHAVIQVTYPNGGSGSDPSCEGGVVPASEGGNWGTMLCSSEPFPLDDTPPAVEITYPADGQQFDVGSSFELTADATDDNGVTETELYLDGQPMQKDLTPPYAWDISDVPEGVYEFGVVALDGPNWAASQPVTIYVGVEPPDPGPTGTSSGGATDGGGTGGDTASTTGDTASTTDDPPPATSDGDTDTDGDTAGASTSDDGCGCRGSQPGGAGLAFIGLLLGAGRRRRRP